MLSNNEQRERNSRIAAIAGTILVHALILISLMFLALHVQMPLPEEASVEVNFSYNNDSPGDDQPQIPALSPDAMQHPGQNTTEEQMGTKKDELSAASEKNKQKTVKPETAPVGKPTAIVETPHELTIIRKAVDPGKSTRTSSGGNQVVIAKPDVKVKPGETALSPEYNDNDGKGNSVSFELGGRGSSSFQKPVFNSPVEGKIIVSIIVDRDGKVIYASAGAKGSTISDIKIRQQAENAARKSRFAPDANAPQEQRGTITYIFVKQK